MDKISDILINEIGVSDFCPELLAHFERYQESPRNWHKKDGRWVLRDEMFIEDWDNEKKIKIINGLRKDVEDGGSVLGAFWQNKIIGFASVRSNRFGTARQYVELNMMHASNGFRGRGIGKRLFKNICIRARQLGAKKLYISANPAEDSVAFYRKIGCVDAIEINSAISNNAPFDYQFEYVL